MVLVFSPPDCTIKKSEPGLCMTPPIDTIKFAELPAGTKGVAPIRRVKSVVEPLKEPEISAQITEFPSGKSPVIDAESAGIYPRAVVTSLEVIKS